MSFWSFNKENLSYSILDKLKQAAIFGFLFFSRVFLKLVEFFGSLIGLNYGYFEHGIIFGILDW